MVGAVVASEVLTRHRRVEVFVSVAAADDEHLGCHGERRGDAGSAFRHDGLRGGVGTLSLPGGAAAAAAATPSVAQRRRDLADGEEADVPRVTVTETCASDQPRDSGCAVIHTCGRVN